MASLDMSSIMDKVRAASKSHDIQQRMRDTVMRYRTENVDRTAAGSVIMTVRRMEMISEHFIDLLTMTASMCGLPDSVMEHFDSLRMAPIEYKSGNSLFHDRFFTRVYFNDVEEGLAFRTSLFVPSTNTYTGSGIDNIISLFNTGYVTRRPVHGVWLGHTTYPIYSKTFRAPEHFIEDAVDTFNAMYGRFGVEAEYSRFA